MEWCSINVIVYYATIKTYGYAVMLSKKAGYEVVYRWWIQLWERKSVRKTWEGNLGKSLSDCFQRVESQISTPIPEQYLYLSISSLISMSYFDPHEKKCFTKTLEAELDSNWGSTMFYLSDIWWII